MLKDYRTKDVSNKDAPEQKPIKQTFSFPQYGISVEAYSLEEAERELKKLIKQ
jgi:hypothetical protein